ADRRADQGAGARDRDGADRVPEGDQAQGRDHPFGRAEFLCRPRARRPCAGDGQWHRSPSRRDGGPGRRRAAAGRVVGPEPGDASVSELAANDPLPKPKRDIAPILLPVALALVTIPLIGSPSTWLTLTAASLAMGMMIFIMA